MSWIKKGNARESGPLVAINHKPRVLPRSPHFGEQFFIEAKRQGRRVVYWEKNVKPDIILMIDWTLDFELLEHYRSQGVKVVLRMDGIGVKDGKKPEKDNRVYNTFLKSDAVIFQSKFCQEIWEKVFTLRLPSTIILNGADESIFSQEARPKNFGFPHFLVTAARWRPWKGLDQVVETFLKIDREDLGLVVIGANAEVPKHPRIVATGKLGHKQMAGVFRAADLFIYLPWHEWCPKVVAQALVAGLPVVCTYKGGTRELVQDCGIIVHGPKDEVVPFAPNPANIEEAVQAVNTLLAKQERCRERQDLFLSTTVNNYFDFLQKVLDKAV